jgi:hypothetical protein
MRTATDAPRALLGFTVAVTRVVAVLALLGTLSAVYLLALGERTTGPQVPGTRLPAGAQVWKESYSRRFPRCVAVVLWPPREPPRALVLRDRWGSLTEVPTRQAEVRLRDRAPGARLTTVGMCR